MVLLQSGGLKMAIEGTEGFFSVFEMQNGSEIPKGGKGIVHHIELYMKPGEK